MLLICKPIAACETTCKVTTAKFWIYPGVTVGYVNPHMIVSYRMTHDTVVKIQ